MTTSTYSDQSQTTSSLISDTTDDEVPTSPPTRIVFDTTSPVMKILTEASSKKVEPRNDQSNHIDIPKGTFCKINFWLHSNLFYHLKKLATVNFIFLVFSLDIGQLLNRFNVFYICRFVTRYWQVVQK